MTSPSFISAPRSLTARRAAAGALLAGVVAWLLLRFTGNDFLPVAHMLFGCDVGVVVYLGAVFWLLHDASAVDMARHAAQHRAGRHFVLAISVAAMIVSLAVIAFEIRAINAEPDDLQNVRVLFVLVTVALSWLFIHTSFATHYAFEYYGAPGVAAGEAGGLVFPGDEAPDFWDFWHFSIVIGLTAQTADVAIASKAIRRIASVHGIGSFLFNTVILAAAISFAGAFLKPG